MARWIVVAAGVAVLGLAAFHAITYGLAGSAAGNAMRQLERVSAVSAETPAWSRVDLEHSLREVTQDPSLHELTALIAMRTSNDPAELSGAERHLAAAIEARPGSGYEWANLAEVKYRLGRSDAGFEKALVNAQRLAPYEPEVQRTIADYGLAVIDAVGPQTRTAIEGALAAGMRRNAPEILQIASRRGRLDVACRHLDGVPRPAESKWMELCESMEATP